MAPVGMRNSMNASNTSKRRKEPDMEIIGKKGEVKHIQLAKPESGSGMLYPIIGIDIKEES